MPRLTTGQLAQGVAWRQRSVRDSILSRFRELKSAGANIANHAKNLASLAAWDDIALGISPVSINSLRKYAELHLRGGTSELARLMRKRSPTIPSGRLKTPTQSPRLNEAALADAIFSFSLRYGDLLDRVRALALHDPGVRHELSVHTNKYGWVGGLVADGETR